MVPKHVFGCLLLAASLPSGALAAPTIPTAPLPTATLPDGGSAIFRQPATDHRPPSLPSAVAVSLSLAAPVRVNRISSTYGMRSDPFTGGMRFHRGIDIPAAFGTPVRAAASGTVSIAAVTGGYGNMVELSHGEGLDTRYGHLQSIAVTSGAHVEQGEIIGYVGSTGRSTGAHLHFEVRSFGRSLDPLAPVYVDAVSAMPELPTVPARARWQSGTGHLPGVAF